MAILSQYLFDELLGLKKKVSAINSLDATCSHNIGIYSTFPITRLAYCCFKVKLNSFIFRPVGNEKK